MDSDSKDFLRAVAGQEQAYAVLDEATAAFGRYYKGLLTEGMPEPLAAQLTRDAAGLWWNAIAMQTFREQKP